MDFETQAAYSISIKAADPSLPESVIVTSKFKLAVNDVQETPIVKSIDEITMQEKITSFRISEPELVGEQLLDKAIVGTKNKDKITGSIEGEILAGMKGKDVLKGGKGPDGFLCSNYNEYGVKKADLIKDFNPAEGDSLIINKVGFKLGNNAKFKKIKGKKKRRKAAMTKANIVYDEKKGTLYFNENGKAEGWGDGGLFAKLQKNPIISEENIVLI